MSEMPGIGAAAQIASDGTGAAGDVRPKTAAEAAHAFEALLIGQMMKISREASCGEGWLGSGSDDSSSSVMDFAEQQLAQMLASGGGLGLARLVEQGLSHRSDAIEPGTSEGDGYQRAPKAHGS